jgi:Family of unknown function (DUF6527)
MKQLTPSFLQTIPLQIEDGILYISMRFHTASHKCPCGCGSKIVTPLSPAGWTLIYDGKTISLEPSIGNWSIPCKSHYWIIKNCIEWAPQWSSERIIRGSRRDRRAIEEYYASMDMKKDNAVDGIEIDKENTKGEKHKKKDGSKKKKRKSK